MQYIDQTFAELYLVCAMVQYRFAEVGSPEFGLRFEQVDPGISVFQCLLQAIDMIMVAMRQQDIGDLYISGISKIEHLLDFPCRINDGGSIARVIVYQVDEVLHGAELHAVNAYVIMALLHIQAPFMRRLHVISF
jgi:hypothetical protein